MTNHEDKFQRQLSNYRGTMWAIVIMTIYLSAFLIFFSLTDMAVSVKILEDSVERLAEIEEYKINYLDHKLNMLAEKVDLDLQSEDITESYEEFAQWHMGKRKKEDGLGPMEKPDKSAARLTSLEKAMRTLIEMFNLSLSHRHAGLPNEDMLLPEEMWKKFKTKYDRNRFIDKNFDNKVAESIHKVFDNLDKLEELYGDKE